MDKKNIVNIIIAVVVAALSFFGYKIVNEHGEKINEIIVSQEVVAQKVSKVDTLDVKVDSLKTVVDSIK